MNPAHGIAAFCVALACAAQSPEPAPSPPPTPTTGEQILARAKEVFRAHARPPYVVYTLVRRDKHNGEPDFENSYTLKIWCRTDDRSALTRRVWKGKAYGSLQNVTVAFDEAVDPGPPTADIFERALFAPPPSAAPTPEATDSPLPVIGGVVVNRDYDYRVIALHRDGAAWHLSLAPKRDPDRNRIDDLWVDATTFEITRMRVRDHLYFTFTGQSIDDEFDARFVLRDGLPLIASIHGRTKYDQFETDYTYEDVSFPSALPDWYFAPKTYGMHRDDPPV
ncbi:MAG: hypothetical protein JO103_04850 [Candidatus Eremiobacteraeota bacterium]|nr:hypothetical protein [Candidatus Eremiobacteraeota bacterium]